MSNINRRCWAICQWNCSVSSNHAHQWLLPVATTLLIMLQTKHITTGDWLFPLIAALAWNSLPEAICSLPSMPVFCKLLKNKLFRWSYCTAHKLWIAAIALQLYCHFLLCDLQAFTNATIINIHLQQQYYYYYYSTGDLWQRRSFVRLSTLGFLA